MVKFKYVNEVYMYIDAETSVKYEMNDYFKFRVPGYQFMPAFKNRSWDGYIFIYKLNTSLLPIGLFEVAIRFCGDNGYEYEIDDSILGNDVSYASIETYMNKLNIHSSGEAITPYDFQVKAVHKVAEANKALILSATGSGKSLIAYSSIRYHLDNTDRAKILLIVPTVSLVEQMYSDFVDYSSANGFDVEANCHKVKAGKPKGTRKSVTISTWQSIYKENAHFFRDFTMIIGDECHGFKSKSLSAIMEKTVNAKVKMGLTGTLDETLTHKLVLTGVFGPVFTASKNRELMDRNVLTELNINCVMLQYSDEIRKACTKATYQQEVDFITQSKKRNNFLIKLAGKLKGNTLILFNNVESHAKVVFDMFEASDIDKNVYYVVGSVDATDRELIRNQIENEDGCILIGSYGVLSTGVNIKKLNNIIFAHPSKSKIRVMQSIGRVLRKHKSKSVCILFDISDDLSWKSKDNYTLKHFNNRVDMYNKEKFKVKYNKVIL